MIVCPRSGQHDSICNTTIEAHFPFSNAQQKVSQWGVRSARRISISLLLYDLTMEWVTELVTSYSLQKVYKVSHEDNTIRSKTESRDNTETRHHKTKNVRNSTPQIKNLCNLLQEEWAGLKLDNEIRQVTAWQLHKITFNYLAETLLTKDNMPYPWIFHIPIEIYSKEISTF